MTEWIFPCNPKIYKVEEAFNALNKLDWKQSNPNVKIGDIVYIYVSKPVAAIKYKCRVNKVNLKKIEIDDTAFVVDGTQYQHYPIHMEIEKMKEYSDELTMEKLISVGLNGRIQGPRKINDELSVFISSF